MTKQELEKYLHRLDTVDNTMESISTLLIEWETDINSIDFSVLASDVIIPDRELQEIKIEWFPVSEICARVKNEPFENVETERMLNIIELIQSGIKLIPPIAIKQMQMINGIIQPVDERPVHELIYDGTNRLILSLHSNQAQIPVIIIEQVVKVVFSKSLWNISYTDEFINLQHNETDQKFRLKLLTTFGRLDRSGDYVFSIQ